MKPEDQKTGTIGGWLWKSDPSSENPNFGFVETLYQTCSTALVSLWKSHLRLTTPNPQKHTLKRDIASIQFWEENFPDGHLDTTLAVSSGLKIRVLENLVSISRILISLFRDYDEATSSTQNKRGPQSNFASNLEILLEKAAMIFEAEERSESSESSSEESDDSNSSSSQTPQRRQNLLGRLHSYITCLVNLTPAVERYTYSSQCKAEVQPIPIQTVFQLSPDARPYAMLIRDRSVL